MEISNVAYVFQNNITGIQIFVYHCNNKNEAESKIKQSKLNINDWTYLCKKIAISQ